MDIKVVRKKTVSNHSGATPEKVILAIDGATKSGYAIWRNGAIIESGTKRLSHLETKRLVDFQTWLSETVRKYKVTDIVAEDIYREHSRTKDNAFFVLSQLRAILLVCGNGFGIDPEFLNPLRVKNYMFNGTTCNRATDKQRMINRVTHLGYTLESEKADDEADAIGILLTYLNEERLPIKHPTKQ